jgi:serine/threonine protein kinase
VDVARGTLSLEDGRRYEQLQTSAKAAWVWSSSAIVPVYDLGRTTAGMLYFAMKRVKGRTLREILDALRRGDEVDERFSPRRLLSAFSQVCQAVGFAHSRGQRDTGADECARARGFAAGAPGVADPQRGALGHWNRAGQSPPTVE